MPEWVAVKVTLSSFGIRVYNMSWMGLVEGRDAVISYAVSYHIIIMWLLICDVYLFNP